MGLGLGSGLGLGLGLGLGWSSAFYTGAPTRSKHRPNSATAHCLSLLHGQSTLLAPQLTALVYCPGLLHGHTRHGQSTVLVPQLTAPASWGWLASGAWLLQASSLSMYPSIILSIYPTIYLSIYLSIHPSIHPSISQASRSSWRAPCR